MGLQKRDRRQSKIREQNWDGKGWIQKGSLKKNVGQKNGKGTGKGKSQMLTCDGAHGHTFISSNTWPRFSSDISITFLLKDMQGRGAKGRLALDVNMSENAELQVSETEIFLWPNQNTFV